MRKLVIVESPTKAKTIKRYLGKDFMVLSSFGHIRDLPKKNLGIDIEKDYKPEYTIPENAEKRLEVIKDAIQSNKFDSVILAPDEDREGEAIAFHLRWIIKQYAPKMKFERITFHEITKSAIEEALKHPRGIDTHLFNAQQARRVLDRLVGYNLSPLLWKKIRFGLSAGRVQSVALRLIVEREREREEFKEEEFWTIDAHLAKDKYRPNYLKAIASGTGAKSKSAQAHSAKNATGAQADGAKLEDFKNLKEDPEIVSASLTQIDGEKLKKLDIENEKKARRIETDLEKEKFEIEKITKRETRRRPDAPYRTSTLQRDAANKLGYSAKQTMRLAQQLYEGIKLEKGNTGLITYMRTDSLNIAFSALKKAQTVIGKEFGDKYTLESPRYFTKKAKGAQEAHEAIRPTFPAKTPESLRKFLKPQQFKLYSLIWRRFIASQMKEAIFDKANVTIQAGKYTLEAVGSLVKFDGYLKVYGPNFKIQESRLPELTEKEILDLITLEGAQHFTQPPARYTDATLIKTLEEYGIGRPSTYAPTLSTIAGRGYVEKDEKKQYVPQEIGFIVNDLLVKNFSNIFDYKFTAQMETDLDEIAEGKKEWVKIIDAFFKPFKRELKEKTDKIKKYEKKTDKKCKECGKPMMEKFGRFGKFYACSGYPECKYTEDPNQKENDKIKRELEKKIKKENGDLKCDQCGAPMVVKNGRFGPFLGCSNYPKCKNIKPIENSSGVKCPLCHKGEIVEKKSRRGIFWACNNYPECKNAMNGKPTGRKCTKCGALMIEMPNGVKKCSNKECINSKSKGRGGKNGAKSATNGGVKSENK